MSRRSLNGIESDDVRSLNGLSVHKNMLKKLKATQPLEYDADTFTYSLKGLNGFTANKFLRVNPAGDALIYADDNNTEYTATLPLSISPSNVISTVFTINSVDTMTNKTINNMIATGTSGDNARLTLKDQNLDHNAIIKCVNFTEDRTFYLNDGGTFLTSGSSSTASIRGLFSGTSPISFNSGTGAISLTGLSGFTANKFLKVNSSADAIEYADNPDTNFWDLSSNNVNLYPKENTYNVIIGNKDYNNTNNVELVIDGDMEITGKQRSQDDSEIYIEWNDVNGIQLFAKDTGSGKSYNMAFRNSGQAGSGAAFPYIGCAGTNGSSLAVFITNVATTHTLFNSDLSTTHNGNLVCNNNISVKNGSSTSGSVSFFEDDSFGSNSIKLQAPLTALASDITLTLPEATATLSYNGQNISLFNNDEGFVDSAGVLTQIASAVNISTASILGNPNRTFGNSSCANIVNGTSTTINNPIGTGASGDVARMTLKDNTLSFNAEIKCLPFTDNRTFHFINESGTILTTGDTATSHIRGQFTGISPISFDVNNGQISTTFTPTSTTNISNKTFIDPLIVSATNTSSFYIAKLLAASIADNNSVEYVFGKANAQGNCFTMNYTHIGDNNSGNFLMMGLKTNAEDTIKMFNDNRVEFKSKQVDIISPNGDGDANFNISAGHGGGTNHSAVLMFQNTNSSSTITQAQIFLNAVDNYLVIKNLNDTRIEMVVNNVVAAFFQSTRVDIQRPLHIADATPTTSFDIATFLAASIGNGHQVEMLIGKADSSKNAGKICYYHSSDGATANYLQLGMVGSSATEEILQLYATGEAYVNGSFYAPRMRLATTGGYFETYSQQLMYFGTADNGGNTYFYYNTSLAKMLSAGNWTTFSDSRLKTHIETGDEIEKEMADYFDKIDVNKYGYIKQYAGSKGTTTETRSFGFIAQQVQNVYPQGVGDAGNCMFPSPKSTDPDKIEINDCLAVDKEKINMLLWGKVKQQQKQIDKQQEQIERLEKKINLILALDNDK